MILCFKNNVVNAVYIPMINGPETVTSVIDHLPLTSGWWVTRMAAGFFEHCGRCNILTRNHWAPRNCASAVDHLIRSGWLMAYS